MKSEIDTTRNELRVLWACIKKIAEEDIATPADQGLLMEALSAVAEQEKDTTKPFKMKLDSKFLKPCWHCCNIVLNNNLVKNHIEATAVIGILEKLAIEIDKETMMGKPVLELIK